MEESDMGQRKYPILDEHFEIKVLGACRDEIERGLIKVLLLSGMHIKDCVNLTESNIKKQGSKHYLQWARTKTSRGLQAPIRSDYLEDVRHYLNRPRRLSIKQHQRMIRSIGERAGYEELSPMSFRHSLCVKLIRAGWRVPEIAQRLGCTQGVVIQNYSILRSEELMEMEEQLGTTGGAGP
jgi:site-specific recombinase XerD